MQKFFNIAIIFADKVLIKLIKLYFYFTAVIEKVLCAIKYF